MSDQEQRCLAPEPDESKLPTLAASKNMVPARVKVRALLHTYAILRSSIPALWREIVTAAFSDGIPRTTDQLQARDACLYHRQDGLTQLRRTRLLFHRTLGILSRPSLLFRTRAGAASQPGTATRRGAGCVCGVMCKR
jgi:hypothetical protein